MSPGGVYRPRMRTHGPLLRRRRAAVAWVTGLLAVAAVLGVVHRLPAVRALDDAVLRLVASWEREPLVLAGRLLDRLGSAWVVLPVAIAVAARLAVTHRRRALTAWIVANAGIQVAVFAAKTVVDRARPSDALVATVSSSFPSGHVATAAAVAVTLVLVAARPGPSRLRWWAVAAVWTAMMAADRVYLRAHWPTDALAGAALGVSVALVAALLADLTGRRRGGSPPPTRAQRTGYW